MAEKQTTYVLPEHVSRLLGREAQRNNILAVKIVADIVKTTLGPRGMDKMLVDAAGNITITNDGVTILEEMELDHPAAKMIVEIAKTQEREVGDGTTTAALLAGRLLECAETLLDRRIHPTVIVRGYQLAVTHALKVLAELSFPADRRELLYQTAMTAMTGKGAEGNKEILSELTVRAIEQIASGRDADLAHIKIEKIEGGSVSDSNLIQGIVLNKERANSEMPSRVENAKILLVDIPLELRSPESETTISISSPEQFESFLEAEERRLKGMSEQIVSSGVNVVFCQKGIDNVAQYYLAKAGVFACRRISRSDIEKLALATAAKIVSNLQEISLTDLGAAALVEEVKLGDDSLTYIHGCSNPRALTIVLRGGTRHVIDEIERAIHDGLSDVASVLRSGRVVCGGGAIEIELSRRLRIFARTVSGREQLVIEEFAHALEAIPEALAENAGLDPIEVVSELKKQHEEGGVRKGLNLLSDKIEDVFAAGIIEPLKVKTQALASASEVATMILRIDDVLMSKEVKESVQSQGVVEEK